MLALVAVQIIVLSAPASVWGNEWGTSPHGARHLGAFTTAYAVGLLVVVVRPARARTMLSVAEVLVAALVLSTVVDVIDGSIRLASEVAHLPELLSLAGLWLLPTPGRDRPVGHRGSWRRLRAVDEREAS